MFILRLANEKTEKNLIINMKAGVKEPFLIVILSERRCNMMHIVRMIAYALVITGAIVWGIVGFFNYNIVAALFGDATLLSRIVYSLVGISGITLLATSGFEECYCSCSDDTKHY